MPRHPEAESKSGLIPQAFLDELTQSMGDDNKMVDEILNLSKQGKDLTKEQVLRLRGIVTQPKFEPNAPLPRVEAANLYYYGEKASPLIQKIYMGGRIDKEMEGILRKLAAKQAAWNEVALTLLRSLNREDPKKEVQAGLEQLPEESRAIALFYGVIAIMTAPRLENIPIEARKRACQLLDLYKSEQYLHAIESDAAQQIMAAYQNPDIGDFSKGTPGLIAALPYLTLPQSFIDPLEASDDDPRKLRWKKNPKLNAILGGDVIRPNWTYFTNQVLALHHREAVQLALLFLLDKDLRIGGIALLRGLGQGTHVQRFVNKDAVFIQQATGPRRLDAAGLVEMAIRHPRGQDQNLLRTRGAATRAAALAVIEAQADEMEALKARHKEEIEQLTAAHEAEINAATEQSQANMRILEASVKDLEEKLRRARVELEEAYLRTAVEANDRTHQITRGIAAGTEKVVGELGVATAKYERLATIAGLQTIVDNIDTTPLDRVKKLLEIHVPTIINRLHAIDVSCLETADQKQALKRFLVSMEQATQIVCTALTEREDVNELLLNLKDPLKFLLAIASAEEIDEDNPVLRTLVFTQIRSVFETDDMKFSPPSA